MQKTKYMQHFCHIFRKTKVEKVDMQNLGDAKFVLISQKQCILEGNVDMVRTW